MTSDEQVMVVPSDYLKSLGLEDGLMMKEADYAPIIRSILYGGRTSFRNRKEVEKDESFKQIIPYVVFTTKDQVFTYVRGNQSTEARLRGHRAIGVGGHVNKMDTSTHFIQGDYFYRAYFNGMYREIEEEVVVKSTSVYENTIRGLIYADRTEVGRVHVGILHHATSFDTIKPRNHEITDVRFMSVDEIRYEANAIDDWAKLCIPFLVEVI